MAILTVSLSRSNKRPFSTDAKFSIQLPIADCKVTSLCSKMTICLRGCDHCTATSDLRINWQDWLMQSQASTKRHRCPQIRPSMGIVPFALGLCWLLGDLRSVFYRFDTNRRHTNWSQKIYQSIPTSSHIHSWRSRPQYCRPSYHKSHIGLVPLTFRSLNSFMRPFVQMPRGFYHPAKGGGADCRTHWYTGISRLQPDGVCPNGCARSAQPWWIWRTSRP